MKNHEIQSILINKLSLQEVYVRNDGNHFQIIAVGDVFNGMSRVQKQQTIYAPLIQYISDNYIHSLSIRAYTKKEWENSQKFNNFL